MPNTSHLILPLIAPSQAQKHVTVNEALSRLDAAFQLSVESASTTTPPIGAIEGQSYLVPAGAVNEWAGNAQRIAFFLNGGWEFLDALPGWQIWVRDAATRLTYLAGDWSGDVVATSPNNAALRSEVVEIDYTLVGGATSEETPLILPPNASVFAVTGRVLAEITGTLVDWSLGVDGSESRYGAGLGTGAGAWLKGVTGQPVTYYTPTALKLSANGGDFASGQVRLAIHLLHFDLPDGN